MPLNPQAPYQFQSPQPFPNFQNPQQIQHPQQIQQAPPIAHQQSPYAQQPQQHQHIQPQHQVASQIPSQPHTTSPPSRKRKAPGGVPAATLSSMAPTIGGETSSAGAQTDAAAEEPTPAPPPKKNRTNTPWSPAEEQRLRVMRDANKSWGEIAKSFPTRTEGSVKKHWYKDMHYAEFAEDESQALLNAIKEYEASKWKVIGQKVGKPAKPSHTEPMATQSTDPTTEDLTDVVARQRLGPMTLRYG
ncbi:MAG: hypothetical protein Q9217_005773 [Psora testacea]